MIKRIIALIILGVIGREVVAQDEQKYVSPVGFPITLAGNVAEIRANHFHTGIDIKATKGIGSPVYATADGYVSRVGVSPVSYGNVIYVTHRDGEVTVYGHLDGFSKKISSWVYDHQMTAKSFRVDLYPTSDQFPVKQGDVIGFLGNSGSSGGPHLHYEIRDVQGNAINLVQRGIIRPTDKISPNIYQVTLYEIDESLGAPIFTAKSSFTINQDNAGDWVMSDTLMKTTKPFYLAYQVIDYKNGISNTMGIYALSQIVDSVEQFSFAIDRISFATTRYINTLIQYDLNRQTKYHVIRAYISANNALSLYKNVINRGIINPPAEGSKKEVETTITDDSGNTSTISFTVVRDTDEQPITQTAPTESLVVWNEKTKISKNNLTVTFPVRSLYDSAILPFGIDSTGQIEIGDEMIPLQKSINVVIKQNIAPQLQNKALLLSANNKSINSLTYENGNLTANIRQMGRFTIGYDTIPPKITAPSIKDRTVKWQITDDLSGIATYHLTIDGVWALSEWDPKTKTLSHKIRNLSKEVKTHEIALKISDYKGNISTSKTKLKW